MLKLSHGQERIVQQKNLGTSVIKGNKRSGKTAVAIRRMVYLLEHACQKGEGVLFVCTTPAHKAFVSEQLAACYQLQNISLFENEVQRGQAVIKTVDELIEEAEGQAEIGLSLEVCTKIDEESVIALLPQLRKRYPKVRWLRLEYLDFMINEVEWINACGYGTFELYEKAYRRGAKIKLPKKGNGRKAIWQLRTWVNEALKREGKILKSQMQLEALGYLVEDDSTVRHKHIIIDDADQLTKVQLEYIGHLKVATSGELLFFMSSDIGSYSLAWLGQGEKFSTLGYCMTGRVKQLSKGQRKPLVEKITTPMLTPIEQLIDAQSKINATSREEAKEKKIKFTKELKEVIAISEKNSPNEKKITESKLPWYIETYRYVNKITGVETIFQRDSSAGETYIDEVRIDDVEELPVYTDIAAGMPIELVDEVSGKFDLPGEFLRRRKDIYILHVQGDSMVGADISDGDYVVIQAGNVNNGEIAAIYYNGAATLKRILQEEDHILLVSENPKYKPLVIEDGDFRVMGKLIGVIKPL